MYTYAEYRPITVYGRRYLRYYHCLICRDHASDRPCWEVQSSDAEKVAGTHSYRTWSTSATRSVCMTRRGVVGRRCLVEALLRWRAATLDVVVPACWRRVQPAAAAEWHGSWSRIQRRSTTSRQRSATDDDIACWCIDISMHCGEHDNVQLHPCASSVV